MKTKPENIFSSKTLSYFLQLTETMNYTQAAQLLGITQPALTQQIKKLEHIVGAPLFYSIGKKLHLSDAGRTMLKTTQEIYELLNDAADDIQQTTSATDGKIIIGCLSSLEVSVFSDFIIHYYEMFPGIDISFNLMNRKEIWDGLENNSIDIAIMYLPDENIKNWRPYESKQIVQDRLIFLHHDEELSHSDTVTFEETTKGDWVTYPNNFFLSELIRESYKNQLVDTPHSVAQFTSPFQITEFANATSVNTALPVSFYRAHARDIKLYPAEFSPEINFDLSFVYRKGKNKIPRVGNFFKEFDKYMKNKSYRDRIRAK